MNLQEQKLDALVLAPFQVKEALRCILHTILFSRSLGLTEPLEVQSELFEVTYMRNGTNIALSGSSRDKMTKCRYSRNGQMC